MRFLILDTSSARSSVVIANETVCLAQNLFESKQNQSQLLLPLIEELCCVSETSLQEIDCFAVVQGPGSFTGLRVGLSTIKAFAYAYGKPVVALNSLELIADAIQGEYRAPYVFSRRAHVFAAIYRYQNEKREIILEAKEYTNVFFEEQCELQGAARADAAVLHAEKIRVHALEKIRSGQTTDAFGLCANYLITEVAKSKEST